MSLPQYEKFAHSNGKRGRFNLKNALCFNVQIHMNLLAQTSLLPGLQHHVQTNETSPCLHELTYPEILLLLYR